jgi:hypothetical protein
MASFYGYGRYGAHTWLIGMEEGGGKTAAEITARLGSWIAGGRRELDDVGEFHQRTGIDDLHKWFGPVAPWQPTWGKLIKILLYSRGIPVSTDEVKRFQRTELGRVGGNCTILELLPLPARDKKTWSYNEWTDLPQLVDRPTYEATWRSRRAEHILARIRQHGPRLVVFYGGGDRPLWESVIHEALMPTSCPSLRLARLGQSLCAFTKLPQAISERNLEAVGTTLTEHLASGCSLMRRAAALTVSGTGSRSILAAGG